MRYRLRAVPGAPAVGKTVFLPSMGNVVTIRDVQVMTDLSSKSAGSMVTAFVEHKILYEITGYQRNWVYVFNEYTPNNINFGEAVNF